MLNGHDKCYRVWSIKEACWEISDPYESAEHIGADYKPQIYI